MKLLDYLDPACIKAPLDATDKRGVIDELVDVLAAVDRVGEPDTLKDAVWSREQIRTTGIGHGLAIPHGKLAGLSDLSIAIGKPSDPIEFDAIDGQPVRLVVLLVSPLDRTTEHIQALSRISRLMTMDAFRESIYGAGSADEIHELLKGQEALA
ncbi:MAG: PTS sugar transporter subunit IIA [Planctomycetota bacterium]